MESTDSYVLDDVMNPDAEYDAGVCVGHRSGASGDGVYATIGCVEGSVETAIVNSAPVGSQCDTRDTLTNFCVGTLTATCPAGYTATDCNCVSYWTMCDRLVLHHPRPN